MSTYAPMNTDYFIKDRPDTSITRSYSQHVFQISDHVYLIIVYFGCLSLVKIHSLKSALYTFPDCVTIAPVTLPFIIAPVSLSDVESL